MLKNICCVHVDPLYIPFSDKKLRKYTLNVFQAEVRKHLDNRRDILAYAPTGGGKTLTLLLSPKFKYEEDMPGFVALYPNNTLLANQYKTIEEVVKDAMNGIIVEVYPPNAPLPSQDIPPLTIYKIDKSRDKKDVFPDVQYVALVALSGRYIISEDGVPKRHVLMEITSKVYDYDNKGGVYIIVFATPDTFLLIYTGAYRDFDYVGKTLHNILVALASRGEPSNLEQVLFKTRVMPREQVKSQVSIEQRLLAHPLFIDEFHLYGPYEVDALYAAIKLFKTLTGIAGTPLPIVFSSATPAKDILEELKEIGVEPVEVKAPISVNNGFPVKGPMEVCIVPVETTRKGLFSYYEAGHKLPELVEELFNEIKASASRGNVLVILDRLWMVTDTARRLSAKGVTATCIASIYDVSLCNNNSNVIVGSEATTQGVNLGDVVLGFMSGTNYEDVIQRLGRVGRKGVHSKVYLVAPSDAIRDNPPPCTTDYYGLTEWVSRVYPDYAKRKRDTSRLIPQDYHEIRRKLIYSLGIAAIARVSGNTRMLNKIEISPDMARKLLDSTIGEPGSLVKLVVFRRMGFTVEYIDGNGRRGEAAIGLLTRNFTIKDVLGKRLVIDYTQSRSTLKFDSKVNPVYFKGKFVQLAKLAKLARGKIIIESPAGIFELETFPPDSLVYIASMGSDLAYYLSYTGEGAMISFGTRGDYALLFV